MGFDISGGYAAGAGADALTDLLKQKFLEQMARQNQAQEQQRIRQEQQRLTQQGDYQRENLASMNDARQATADLRNQQTASAQAAAARDQQQQVAAAKLLNDPTTPEPIKAFLRMRDAGASSVPAELLKGPEAPKQPANLEGMLAAAAQSGDPAKLTGVLRIMKQQADATRAPQSQQTIVIQTVDAQGNPVTKIVPKVAGATFQKPGGQGGADSAYTQERNTRVLQSVDELDKKVSNLTTGPGSLLSMIPGTEAKNFSTELDTLKANIAFNELAQMRASSKTGGALGQVSDREGTLLQSTLGGLDAKQSPANFRAQLAKVKASIERWNAAKQQSGGGTMPPAAGGGGSQEFDYVPGKGFVPRGGL